MSTMLAAVFEGNGVLNVKEVPKPRITHPDDLGLKRIISHKVELRDIQHGIDMLNSQQASRVIVYPNGISD